MDGMLYKWTNYMTGKLYVQNSCRRTNRTSINLTKMLSLKYKLSRILVTLCDKWLQELAIIKYVLV